MRASKLELKLDPVPVMMDLWAEVDAKIAQTALFQADAALRATFGPEVFWPGMPAVDFDTLQVKRNSSTGKIFTAASGKALIRICAKLRHPADGSGTADLLKAALVIEKAKSLLGASRILYGACGLARPGCLDGYESLWWSAEGQRKMEAIALIAASGMSWLARPPSK